MAIASKCKQESKVSGRSSNAPETTQIKKALIVTNPRDCHVTFAFCLGEHTMARDGIRLFKSDETMEVRGWTSSPDGIHTIYKTRDGRHHFVIEP